MNDPELHEDSGDDTSDDDYIPGGKPEDVPSEVDSDGDPEDALSDSEILDDKKSRKRKKSSAPQKRQKTLHEPTIENPNESSSFTEEEKKKKDDDLWSDFMKDTGFQSKKSLSENSSLTKSVPSTKSQSQHNSNKPDSSTNKPVEKVKITQIFEFAGEEVKVEKEVAANSAEARLLDNKSTATNSKSNRPVKSRGGLSGIGSVLSQLGKKQKISTLEKTKLDWDQFKKDENLEEELQTHNKGKDGYLERQDFLQRADLRRFEIEKEIRTVERNKRMTN